MRGYGWWYAFGLRFQIALRWNNWALPVGVNWGAEYCYPGLDEKVLEYRWLGVDIGPFAFSVFKDHDLDRDRV